MNFAETVAAIPQIGMDWHRATLLKNSRANIPWIERSIKSVRPDERRCLIVSAGPSLYRENILQRVADSFDEESDFTIIATDGAYLQCLRHHILPDWVVTIDPHPTRIVRWFGDPDFEEHARNDDYFTRQDLDIEFRKNSAAENAKNIRTVDENPTRLAICTAAPANVVARTRKMARFWFAPLVDSPAERGLTWELVRATGCPALTTGGTVGTAAWAFAYQVLRSRDIAVVGMDMGYYEDTELTKTQSWHMLKGDPLMYPRERGPWGWAFTDPTYFWYRQNFRELIETAGAKITNCSEAGLLYGQGIECMGLDEWLASS